MRRKVCITPVSKNVLLDALIDAQVCSFWGHTNTIATAENAFGVNLDPIKNRPAIILDNNNLPTLGNNTFIECWILSPSYCQGFRPAIGEEVNATDIIDWTVLKIEWVD